MDRGAFIKDGIRESILPWDTFTPQLIGPISMNQSLFPCWLRSGRGESSSELWCDQNKSKIHFLLSHFTPRRDLSFRCQTWICCCTFSHVFPLTELPQNASQITWCGSLVSWYSGSSCGSSVVCWLCWLFSTLAASHLRSGLPLLLHN